MPVAERLAELGITLPPRRPPDFNFVSATEHDGIVFLAGHGPWRADQGMALVTGKVGADLTLEEGYEAARLTGVNLLASLQEHLGDLDRVVRVLKLLCMINAGPGFTEFPRVANGCSDLFEQVFGEPGRHARSAVGVAGLPFNIPIEIEAVVAVR